MGFDKSTSAWDTIQKQHRKDTIGRTYLIRDVRWEPGNEHIGKSGKCINAYISWCNSDVRYVELDCAKGVAYHLNELKEI